MRPLLYRILKLRKISAKHVLNNNGHNFLVAASKSYPLADFSILDFDRSTGANSSLLSKMTFTLKMTKFRVSSNSKGKYFYFANIIHFRCTL